MGKRRHDAAAVNRESFKVGNENKGSPAHITRPNGSRKLHYRSGMLGKADLRQPATSCSGTSETALLFPSSIIHIVVFLSLLIRLNIVTSPASWWILHPDEVFQSVEVAHSEVYGYGFRPYEFLSAPQKVASASITEKRYAQLGMYSMRSWMHPRFYMLVFRFVEYCGLNCKPFWVAKIAHAAITATLPYAVFKFLVSINPKLPPEGAILAAIFVGFSEDIVVMGTHTLVNSLLSPLLFLSFSVIFVKHKSKVLREKNLHIDADANNTNNNNMCVTTTETECDFHSKYASSYIVHILAGFILGLVLYIRPDISLTCLVISIVFSKQIYQTGVLNYWKLLYVGSAIAGYVFGGYDDLNSYGVWFVSPLQWLKFQLKYSGPVFGTNDDIFFYVRKVFFANYTMCILSSMMLLIIFLYLLHKSDFLRDTEAEKWLEGNEAIVSFTVQIIFAVFTLLGLYSLQPHKELRFVHDTIVMFLCGGSCSAYCIYRVLQQSIINDARLQHALRMLIYAELCFYVVDCYSSYPSSISETEPDVIGNYKADLESGRVNMCLQYISGRGDPTGVLIDSSIYSTGGYTLLHKDVPIIAKTHFEFLEWDLESRQNLVSRSYFGNKQNVSVSLASKVSDFISEENSHLVLKTVIDNPQYNYAVITASRKLPKKGFKDVFRVGNVTVFKRLTTRLAKAHLKESSMNISMGSNITLLQYEASWLLTLELPHKAEQRLRRALYLDSQCVRCWQLLYIALKRQNSIEAKVIPSQCNTAVSKEACEQPTEKIELHSEYRFNSAVLGNVQ